MERPRIALLCGGAFAFQSIMILNLEKYLIGICISSNDMQVNSMLDAECARNEMPFLQIPSKTEVNELEGWLDALKPDYIFCICFPHRIPATILQQFPDRFINFHTGPLPAYRGSMPIFEVIRNREKCGAISVHLMEEGFDTGAIVFEESVALLPQDTFSSLAMKLAERTSIAAMNLAQMLEFGSQIPKTDQDESLAHFYPYPKEQDLTIDWETMSAETCIALINACQGWSKGAITSLDGEQLRITSVSPFPIASGKTEKAGTILRKTAQNGIEIVCFDGFSIETLAFRTDYENYAGVDPEQIGLLPGKCLGS